MSVMATGGDWIEWAVDFIDPQNHIGEIKENGGEKYLIYCEYAEELFKNMTLPACIVA